MAELNGGIKAEKPEVIRPQRANLRGLFTELSKAVVKVVGGVATAAVAPTPIAVVGGWNTVASAIPDAVAALSNVGTLTENERAYLLVERAIAGAVAELVGEGRSALKPKEIGDGIFAGADTEEEWGLAPDFLQRPREVALLPVAQKRLYEWLVFQEMPDAQARTTAERLPAYFGLKLHEELTEHAEFFAPLLKMLKSDSAHIAQEEWAWARYRAELVREPFRPLFDETFGLQSVFVPLRAKWIEKPRENRDEKPIQHEVILEQSLNEWWTSDDKDDTLRVLSGDPGSGKSSCAKMWAAYMAEQHPGWRVVFVPLHEFRYKEDLRDGLKIFLKDKARIVADLLEAQSTEKTLLFFDGLDELAMQGESARGAAVAFVRAVNAMLLSLNRDECRVLVVLGGRQLVIQNCGSELRKLKQVLHLQTYSAEERRQWWQQYGTAKGKEYTDVPHELKRTDLESITEQPLLNYLLALSYDREKLDFTKHVTVNAIYADLMDSVYERVWGAGGNVHLRGKNQTLSQDEFKELLEEIGVAVWHSDSRSATLEAIRERCEAADLSDALKKLEDTTEAGIFRLLTAFHIRFKEGQESSVEFTHKSFGEYLTARRVVRLILNVFEQRELREKRRGFGWDAREALVEWAKLCGPKPLDATDINLFQLLVNEVRSKNTAQRDAWRNVLTELIHEMHGQGLPMEKCGLQTFQEMRWQARNSEEALFCALYACLSEETPKYSNNPRPIFASYIGRWGFFLEWELAFAVVSAANHLGWYLGYSNFLGANLIGANLSDSDLERANLTNANLWGANLKNANMVNVVGWQEAKNLNLRDVAPEKRPKGWKLLFHEDGTIRAEKSVQNVPLHRFAGGE